jgi:hypothetical protein
VVGVGRAKDFFDRNRGSMVDSDRLTEDPEVKKRRFVRDL